SRSSPKMKQETAPRPNPLRVNEDVCFQVADRPKGTQYWSMTTFSPPRHAAFSTRGPISEQLVQIIRRDLSASNVEDFPRNVEAAVSVASDVISDDDLQLTLLILQCLHYGGL